MYLEGLIALDLDAKCQNWIVLIFLQKIFRVQTDEAF